MEIHCSVDAARLVDTRLTDVRQVMPPYSLEFQNRDKNCGQNKKRHNERPRPMPAFPANDEPLANRVVLVTPARLTQRQFFSSGSL